MVEKFFLFIHLDSCPRRQFVFVIHPRDEKCVDRIGLNETLSSKIRGASEETWKSRCMPGERLPKSVPSVYTENYYTLHDPAVRQLPKCG